MAEGRSQPVGPQLRKGQEKSSPGGKMRPFWSPDGFYISNQGLYVREGRGSKQDAGTEEKHEIIVLESKKLELLQKNGKSDC